MVEAGIRRLADAFWAAAGDPPPFPRDLAGPTCWALPLDVVERPALDLAAIRDYLAAPGLADRPGGFGPNRRLHGALVATGETGVVFLDAADPPDEQRLSLAHEVAHYLADYRAPRDRAARRLGPTALAVLDGRRPPTANERVAAALLDVSLAPHVHLLARGADGDVDRAGVAAAEWRAHRLALELLAPADAVRARWSVRGFPSGGPGLVRALAALLVDVFGLSPAVARRFARDLAGRDGEATAGEWLGLVKRKTKSERAPGEGPVPDFKHQPLT